MNLSLTHSLLNHLLRKCKNYFSHLDFGQYQNGPFFQRHALHFLNGAQFLGVINDNAFKFLIVFLFIHLKGVTHSNEILFWVGVIYVVPFLLFSSVAGVLADRFSKQRLIVFFKFTEVLIMGLGIIAFFFQVEWASYTLLFLLSLQSAFFSPPKYSIIPELISSVRGIAKANGSITSFTYLGIIFGTFLASFLTQVTKRHFALTACVCTVIAIGGFVSSLFIPYTEPKRSKRIISPLFFSEIYRNLKHAKTIPYLLSAILGSSSFLFIGAYFQLNVVPYAIQTLHMDEVGGGYLFLLTAVGIACGALLAGRLLSKRIEVGLSCLSGMMLALAFFIFSFLTHLFPILVMLFLIGVCGGLYIVPLNSYVQTYSPDQNRGQIVAASNFLSFSGVLFAPMILYFFGNYLGFSAAQGFMLTSFLIFLLVSSITCGLSSYFFSYLSLLFLKLLYKVDATPQLPKRECPFVLTIERAKPLLLYMLCASYPRLHVYILRGKKQLRHLLMVPFSSIHVIHLNRLDQTCLHLLIRTIQDEMSKGNTPCLLLLKHHFPLTLLHQLMREEQCEVRCVSIKKRVRRGGQKGDRWKRPLLSLEFLTLNS